MPKIFARAYGARIKGLLSYPNRPKIVAKFVVFTCGLPKKHTVFPQFSSFYTSGKISWQSVKTFCLGTPLEKFLATPLVSKENHSIEFVVQFNANLEFD